MEVLQMDQENKEPVYYPVKVHKDGRKEILGLPQGEDKKDYEIELATGEAFRQIGSMVDGEPIRYVAVKKTKEVLMDERDWTDQGGVGKD